MLRVLAPQPGRGRGGRLFPGLALLVYMFPSGGRIWRLRPPRAYCVCYDHAQGPLGRPSSPQDRSSCGVLPQTPPLGAQSRAQESSSSRV